MSEEYNKAVACPTYTESDFDSLELAKMSHDYEIFKVSNKFAMKRLDGVVVNPASYIKALETAILSKEVALSKVKSDASIWDIFVLLYMKIFKKEY